MSKGLFLRLRRLAGVLLRERPGYRARLDATDSSYLEIRNRGERLVPAPAGPGVRCDWQFTSTLHAPKHLPSLGQRLMARSLREHPIRRAATPESASSQPEVTFLIGHRGMSRLPHLLATLESIAAQVGAAIECIVIEQDEHAHLAGRLPAWVRHVHTPTPIADMAYCRAWTFNVGAREARGRLLVLHDNDMLVPADYASCLLRHLADGFEVMNLKRFVFYLDEQHTAEVFAGRARPEDRAPDYIVQNLEGGGSVAITAEAYAAIGGLDESFVGWGGEDNEFWERANTRRTWPFAYLPIVHLWHPAQAGKHEPGFHTLQHYRALARTPAAERIDALRRLDQGNPAGPVGLRKQ